MTTRSSGRSWSAVLLRCALCAALTLGLSPAFVAAPALAQEASAPTHSRENFNATLLMAPNRTGLNFKVGSWISVKAEDTWVDSSYVKHRDVAPESELAVTWQMAPSHRSPESEWVDIPAPYTHELAFTIPAELEGKSLRCKVLWDGVEKTTRRGSNPVKPAEGASSGSDKPAEKPEKPALPNINRIDVQGLSPDNEAALGSSLTLRFFDFQSHEITSDLSFVWLVSDSPYIDSAREIQGSSNALTYTIPLDQSFVGKTLFVRAQRPGNVPVTKKIATIKDNKPRSFELSRVSLNSTTESVHPDSRLTAEVFYEKHYKDVPLPAEAPLELQWQWSDTRDGVYAPIQEGVDELTHSLTVSPAFLHKFVRARAFAGKNYLESKTYQVVSEGEFDLSSLRLSAPQGDLFTGDSIAARVEALVTNPLLGNKDVSKQVKITWLAGTDLQDPASFEVITGATAPTLVIPESLAHKFIKVIAQSGASQIETSYPNQIQDGHSLKAAVRALEKLYWRPSPHYGTDTNINTLVEEKLASLGFTDIKVRVLSATPSLSLDGAELGLSDTQDTNGQIQYFFVDPDTQDKLVGFSTNQQLKVRYLLSQGKDSLEYSPLKNAKIPWNEDKLRSLLQEKSADLQPVFAEGEDAGAVASAFELPNKLSGKAWSKIVWESSNPDLLKLSRELTQTKARPQRDLSDKPVQLIAHISLLDSDAQNISFDKCFDLTIASDKKKIQQASNELQEKLDARIEPGFISQKNSGAELQELSQSINLPTPKEIGVDGKYTQLVYASDNPLVIINGYRAHIIQPLPGQPAQTVTIQARANDKAQPAIAAQKSFEIRVAPLQEADITAALDALEQAKKTYASALLDGQEPGKVTHDLRTPQAFVNGAWVSGVEKLPSDPSVIVPVDLPGYDPMGTAQWRLFRSSNPRVVHDENLLVSPSEYNTQVTVSSSLASEKFRNYAAIYGEDPTFGERFKMLAGTPVEASFKVLGTTGQEDPDALAVQSFNLEVIGVTDHKAGEPFKEQFFLESTPIEFKKIDNQSVWDLIQQALKDQGLKFTQGMMMPESITSKTGQVLKASTQAPWSYWSWEVNGKYLDVMPNLYYPKAGDTVVLRFIDASGTLVPADVPLKPNAPLVDLPSFWPSFDAADRGFDIAAPTAKAQSLWLQNFGNKTISEPLLINGQVYLAQDNELLVLDTQSGKVLKRAQLAYPIESTARLLYKQGRIFVPLSLGVIQALDAQDLNTLWISDKLTSSHDATLQQQGLNTLRLIDGKLIAATVTGETPNSGFVYALNPKTGLLLWKQENTQAGYYWSAPAQAASALLIPNDAGSLELRSLESGALISSLALSDSIRSSIVQIPGRQEYLVVSRDGVLHKVVYENGQLREKAQIKFGRYSTSTPVIVGDKIFVGGQSEQGQALNPHMSFYAGQISCIDLNTFKLIQSVSTDEQGSIGGLQAKMSGDVKSRPLVVENQEGTFVYFTSNMKPGGVYVWKLGEDHATRLFVPELADQEYTMSSVVADAQGHLYYINDAHALFALVPATASSEKPFSSNPNAGQSGNSSSSSNSAQGQGSGTGVNHESALETGLEGASGAAQGWVDHGLSQGQPALHGAGFTGVQASTNRSQASGHENAYGPRGNASQPSASGTDDTQSRGAAVSQSQEGTGQTSGQNDSTASKEQAPVQQSGMPTVALICIVLGVLGLCGAGYVYYRRKKVS